MVLSSSLLVSYPRYAHNPRYSIPNWPTLFTSGVHHLTLDSIYNNLVAYILPLQPGSHSRLSSPLLLTFFFYSPYPTSADFPVHHKEPRAAQMALAHSSSLSRHFSTNFPNPFLILRPLFVQRITYTTLYLPHIISKPLTPLHLAYS